MKAKRASGRQASCRRRTTKVYEVLSDHEIRGRMLFASKASAEECARLLQEKYGAVYKDYLVTVHEWDLKP